MSELEDKLTVGTKICIGEDYSESVFGHPKPGQIIELVNGEFDYDNGLYTETQQAPAIWNEQAKEYDSIYHLFGNDLEDFMDCEVVE